MMYAVQIVRITLFIFKSADRNRALRISDDVRCADCEDKAFYIFKSADRNRALRVSEVNSHNL